MSVLLIMSHSRFKVNERSAVVSCLNTKGLFARNRRDIGNLSNCSRSHCTTTYFINECSTPFLQNTSGWLLLTKLHDPNRRKMRLSCFEFRWLWNGMNMPCHSLFSFLFVCLERTLIREQLDENDFRRYIFFAESIILEVMIHR